MPLVKEQVKSQIKVCDLSRMQVEIQPADFVSWSAACEQLTKEQVAPLKAEQRRALKKAGDNEAHIASVNEKYSDMIEAQQAEVANLPLEFHVEIATAYNFL